MISNLEKSTMWSSKYYRTNLEGDRSIYSPLEGIVAQSPPATPYSEPHKGKTLPETPPEEDMAAHLKLPTFKGAGDEDMDRFWFVADSVWTAQGVASDTVKRVQLSLAFEERALDYEIHSSKQKRIHSRY